MRLLFPLVAALALGGGWFYFHGGQGLLEATGSMVSSGPNFKVDTYEKTVRDISFIGPDSYHQETRLRIVSMEEKPVSVNEIVLNKAASGSNCDLTGTTNVIQLPYVTSGLGDTIEFGPGICGTVVNVQLKTDKGVSEYDVR